MTQFWKSNRRLSDLPGVMHQLSAAADELQISSLKTITCSRFLATKYLYKYFTFTSWIYSFNKIRWQK